LNRKDPILKKKQTEFQKIMFDPKTYQTPEIVELTKGYAYCIPPDRTVIEVSETVEGGESVVLPSSVVEHLIRTATHRVLMNSCICRETNDCKDYSAEMGCLFLNEAAKGIHPKLGRVVSEEEALDHARRCTETGLVPCVGKMKADADALFLDDMNYLTVCFCCDCCCLARMFQHSEKDLAAFIRRIPGVNLRVTDACIGCEACVERCIFEALRVEDGLAVIDDDKCKGCGRCAEECPEGAIKFDIEESAYTGKALEGIEKNLMKS
jgi:NAD-dependent dihydropyrimidine dehydrogenase PreA subunit